MLETIKRVDWFLGIAIGTAIIACSANFAIAQITPDSTLPNNSRITSSDNTNIIEGGTQAGKNLFHSFQQFSLPTGSTAFFNNTLDIQNIISRVTGGSLSNIDGLIRANGTANIFLLNPNGIIFGKNASLNIGGSFVASTANAIQFGNQRIFSATNPEAYSSLLTINPSALLFNQINQNATIQNNSIAPAGIDSSGISRLGLRVPDGKSLLLVGGNVSMDGGKLNAVGGRVELGGLAEPGNINLILDKNNFSLKFPENLARADVLLTNQANVFVAASGGGDIAVNARNVEILGGSLLSAGIGRDLGIPETVAGDITLIATGEINVAGVGSAIVNNVRLGAKGNGGNIIIDAASVSLRDDAQFVASTFGQGNAGNVTVGAKNAVSLAGNAYILSAVEPGGVGKGGNIDINAASLSLTNGAQLITITREASETQPAGRGDAGNVNVKVTGVVDIAGEKNGFVSGIRSFVDTGTVGNGGNITIESGDFSLRDGAELVASTFGQGNAGNVTVRAKDAVSLADSDILSTVEAGGVGKGGNIDINAATLSLIDGAQLQTNTNEAFDSQPAGQGDAGNVNVKVTGVVDIAGAKNGFPSGIFSRVSPGTVGNGGNITIDSSDFFLRDSAKLSASAFGQGNAGNVTVRATNTVSLAGSNIFSTVEAGGVGKGGNININAATLSLFDGAQLQTRTNGAFDGQPAGKGDAGDVNVKVTGVVDIADQRNGFPSGIFSLVDIGTVGNGGNISIDSGDLSLRDGAYLSASTYGQGNAGNVTASATNTVSLADSYILSTVESGGVGKGGNININAATLSLIDGAQLVTITRGAYGNQSAGRGDAGNVNVKVTSVVDIAGEKNGFASEISSFVDAGTVGNGGNITIDSGNFSLRDGAQLIASTFGQGNAGIIKVNATDFLTISGKSSNLNSGLFVNSQSSTAIAGDIILTSPKVTLDNSGTLKAESTSGNGGNINLNSDLLLLRHGAQISTNAGTEQQGGDGGNININSKFIVAVPNENSDITANAFNGSGGKIQINATNIFGIAPLSRQDLERLRPLDLDPSQLSSNDITAVSQQNPSLSGSIQINTPDADPSRGLAELPTNVVDVSGQIANSCIPGSRQSQSSFIATGRGGLPISPNQPLQDTSMLSDWVRVAQKPAATSNQVQVAPLLDKSARQIVEAQGWVVDRNGDFVLVAKAPQPHPRNSWQASVSCPAL
ncbi:hypothetical protein BV378_11405 [Nostoc sp. RF31YmG]|nr:hypothetical protein BV378_11405 [Nostoc sp. RF31YmG]